jgi:hypothetical protein
LCPGGETDPLRGRSFWESSPPMGPIEDSTRRPKDQGAGRRRHGHRPRMRRCLLKGCEQRFAPRQARQRYCSELCRQQARNWARWKAQQRYRETEPGKQNRNSQSRRYRERVRNRQPPAPEPVSEAARVIPNEDFFRSLLRPAGLLRKVRSPVSKPFTALLLAGLPASTGARAPARAALQTSADLSQTY